MAASGPPSIPVRHTTKSMYRPVSKLNGDQLPMLRRVKRPELSGRITLYNHYTERVLDTALNVSFKQHEHKMETIRKEQAHIYKSLCRIQRLKRRVQRDEHEQRRQEIRNLFNRQRRRQLMRRVVARFRENVITKRAERMIQQTSDEYKAPVLSAQQLLKYAGGLRRHTQPDVGSNVQEEAVLMDDTANTGSTTATGSSGTNSHYQMENTPKIQENQQQVECNHNDDNIEKSTQKGNKVQNTKLSRKFNYTDTPLEMIPEVNASKTCSRSRTAGKSESNSLTRHKGVKTSLSSKSLPSMQQHGCRNVSNEAKSGQIEVSGLMSSQSLKSPGQEENRAHDESIIDQVDRENTREEDYPGRVTHQSLTPEVSERSSEDEEGGHQHPGKKKRQRKNIVKEVEKERAERAKARTRILDEEPFTRYLRKPQEKITAMYGLPKKAEFVPPSGKLRHEQNKLIRRQQDKDIQGHIDIERFFQDVFASKEPTYKQPTVEKEEAPKKATLSLASVLGQMYTPNESVRADKNSLESLKACQYLRVYNPFLKRVQKRRTENEESSWAVAERKLRAGFMALSFLK